jgi:hypothetical protein
MSTRPSVAFLLTLLLSCSAFPQDQPKVAPLPYDPLELATGPTVIPDTPAKRELLLSLLEHARQNNGMHSPGTPPFNMKVSFNSSGTSHYTGFGEVEETWMSASTFRWSARLGDYSQSASSMTDSPTTTSRTAPSRFASRWSASPSSGRSPAGLPLHSSA